MYLTTYLKTKFNVNGVDMLFKFSELDPNEKFECDHGCGRVVKLSNGLFCVDRELKTIHLYCSECAEMINNLYHLN